MTSRDARNTIIDVTRNLFAKDFTCSEKRASERLFALAFVSAMALLFIWSIAGTVAMRHLLLTWTLALLLPTLWTRPWTRWRNLIFPLSLLGLLSLWFLAQAVIVSTETSWALGELRGQWLPALVAMLIGLLLAEAAFRTNSVPRGDRILIVGVVLVFSSQALIAILQAIHSGVSNGNFFQIESLPKWGKLERSFILNILLAFLSVDLLSRVTGRGRFIQIPLSANIGFLIVSLLALYFSGARNGVIALAFLSLSCTFFYLYDQHRKISTLRTALVCTLVLLLLGAYSYATYKADGRWKVFLETAEIAWDIENYDAWKGDKPMPALSSGSVADHSAYMRISWIHVGIGLIAEKPLGVGYGRNAFGHALRGKADPWVGHAHSGLIDLGVAAGLPALLLWFAFIASLLRLGWHGILRNKTTLEGFLLILISTGFTGRMMLDSVNRDHMLQLFFFLIGVLLVYLEHKKLQNDIESTEQ